MPSSLKASSLMSSPPSSLFLSFVPSPALVTPKYSCHLSVSSPSMLLPTLKSCSISLSSTSYRSACKAAAVTSPPLTLCLIPVAPMTSCQSTCYVTHLSFFFFQLSPLLQAIDQISVSRDPWRRHRHAHKNTHLSVCATSGDLSTAKDAGPVWPVNSTRWSGCYTCSGNLYYWDRS